jgi:cell filamentation protein
MKISIRFYKDREVRAVWDEENAKWWFAAVDVAAILSESDDPANYCRVLKNRLNAEKIKPLQIVMLSNGRQWTHNPHLARPDA